MPNNTSSRVRRSGAASATTTTRCLCSNTTSKAIMSGLDSKSTAASVATIRSLPSQNSLRTGSPTTSAATTETLESHSNVQTPTRPHQQCEPSHCCYALGEASTCTLCNVTESAHNHAIADQNRWDIYLKNMKIIEKKNQMIIFSACHASIFTR
jgi:hypothetical protein